MDIVQISDMPVFSYLTNDCPIIKQLLFSILLYWNTAGNDSCILYIESGDYMNKLFFISLALVLVGCGIPTPEQINNSEVNQYQDKKNNTTCYRVSNSNYISCVRNNKVAFTMDASK